MYIHPRHRLMVAAIKKTGKIVGKKIEQVMVDFDKSMPKIRKENRRTASRNYAKRKGIRRIDGQVTKMKISIAQTIRSEIVQKKLKHYEAASITGIPRSKITAIVNFHVDNITLDLLIEALSSFGISIDAVRVR